MSEIVSYTGKIKLIPKLPNETTEDICKRIITDIMNNHEKLYDSWTESLLDEYYDKYLIAEDENGVDQIYEIIETEQLAGCDVYIASRNSDDTISFVTTFYNGGQSLSDAIEESVANMITKERGLPY